MAQTLPWKMTLDQSLVKKGTWETSLVVQWIRLHAPSAGGPAVIPGQGTESHMHTATKISHATTCPHAATKELASHN